MLRFADGGPAETVVLHQGTEAECRQIYKHARVGGFEESKRIVESCTLMLEAEPPKPE